MIEESPLFIYSLTDGSLSRNHIFLEVGKIEYEFKLVYHNLIFIFAVTCIMIYQYLLDINIKHIAYYAVPTHTHTLVVQFDWEIPVVAHATMLAVLAARVVLTAHTRDNVQVVDVTAAVGVAMTLTVWEEERKINY